MTIDIFKRLMFMVGLVLLQVLVLNHIHLFNIATPLLCVMMPLHFDTSQPRWSALLWCFCTGLLIDIMSNTPGIAAASLTLIGMMQPPLLKLFVQDEEGVVKPTLKTIGFGKYLAYSTFIILVYCFVFFTLEAFSFFNPLLWLECIGTSTLLTLFCVISIEKIRGK